MEKIEFNEVNIQNLFGYEAAKDENPERLQQYYFKSDVYEKITSDLPLRILVGHKGIGKSALFNVAMFEDNQNGKLAILIQPNDITNLGNNTIEFLETIKNWTYGLKEIIITKVLERLGIPHDAERGKIYLGSVLDYLVKVLNELPSGRYTDEQYEKIFNFLALPSITVYIDDLDRGWQGRKEDVTRLSALFNAIRDLIKLNGQNYKLYFRIALRSDVYFLVRTSDESTDKIENSVVWHTWKNQEIFALLVKRIETYYQRSINEVTLSRLKPVELANYLKPIMEPRFTGSGLWQNAPTDRVLMSLIRRRPRDLVKLCTLAARQAYTRKSNLIQTQDFKSIFANYSQSRVTDTVNEQKMS